MSLRVWIRHRRQAFFRWWRRPSFFSATPVSRKFGAERGLPIDRYYIEKFLDAHRAEIKGQVLEIGDATYTRRFGGQAVIRGEVLHKLPGNPQATRVGDLTQSETFQAAEFDCVILTQTLQFIFDVAAAIRTIKKILKPGGVVLATLPGISQISIGDMDRWGDYWRFTALGAQRLFETEFVPENLQVQAHGNLLTATAFLHGLAVPDLVPSDLEVHDPQYHFLVTVRAQKPMGVEASKPA